MAGCASPVTLFHDAEGGDIAQARQPPPGSDLPYPNLASVPARPVALTTRQQAQVQEQLAEAKAAPEHPTSVPEPASAQALDDLALPNAPPPPPQVPGINLPATTSTPVEVASVPVAAPVTPPDGAPISLAFPPRSAILSSSSETVLAAMAASRGSARVLVGGFGGFAGHHTGPDAGPDAAALRLALRRARRIADALTAAGVPPAEITLVASAGGSGGFAQLVY